MSMLLKVRVTEVNPKHTKVTLFMGIKDQTLSNRGQLVFNTEGNEYQSFGAALCLGSEQMGDHFFVEFEERLHEEWCRKEENNYAKNL